MLSSSLLYGNSKVGMFLEINAQKNVASTQKNMLKTNYKSFLRIVESFLDRRKK